jgi:GST-like protein
MSDEPGTKKQKTDEKKTDEKKEEKLQSLPEGYEVPKVWQNPPPMGGKINAMNKPEAGARYEAELPKGDKPYQLYSLFTPNGQKVSILLEELGLKYDPHVINIMKNEQFSSGFTHLNPNSKIPVLLDTTVKVPHDPDAGGLRVFESGNILLYLAEKHGKFIPKDPIGRTECLNWLFWQMGTAPYIGGGFGHFYRYAPVKIEYCINRFSMEAKRILDVLDKHLASKSIITGEDNTFICGKEYTIADMAIFPWISCIEHYYQAREFLDLESYTHVERWCKLLLEREAVIKGMKVCPL